MQTEWRPESLKLAQEIKRHAESKGITAGQFAFANGTIPSGLGVLRVNTADEASKTVRGLAGWLVEGKAA